MPRGYIHQADTLFTETHSLHLTFSSYQQNSMYDFLQVVRSYKYFIHSTYGVIIILIFSNLYIIFIDVSLKKLHY